MFLALGAEDPLRRVSGFQTGGESTSVVCWSAAGHTRHGCRAQSVHTWDATSSQERYTFSVFSAGMAPSEQRYRRNKVRILRQRRRLDVRTVGKVLMTVLWTIRADWAHKTTFPRTESDIARHWSASDVLQPNVT